MIPCTYQPLPDSAALDQSINAWTQRDPLPYALICGVAARISASTPGWCGVVHRQEQPIAALAQTPPWPILLASPLPPDASSVACVVETLRARRQPLPGINAPAAWTQAVTQAIGARVVDTMGMRLHRLAGRPVLPCAAEGQADVFRATEIDLLNAWLSDFQRAVEPSQVAQRVDPSDRAALADFLCWRVGDAPVSMARRARPYRGGHSIGPVYTPSGLRGRGCAGAVVHALCTQLLRDGNAYVALFTDLANPISNRLYARIGFVPVLDQVRLLWDADALALQARP